MNNKETVSDVRKLLSELHWFDNKSTEKGLEMYVAIAFLVEQYQLFDSYLGDQTNKVHYHNWLLDQVKGELEDYVDVKEFIK